jgi:hypothetical protein
MSESNTPTQDMAAEMLEEMIKGREWTQDPERLRDFFAAAALQGLLAHGGEPRDYRELAATAFQLAHSMMISRENWG